MSEVIDILYFALLGVQHFPLLVQAFISIPVKQTNTLPLTRDRDTVGKTLRQRKSMCKERTELWLHAVAPMRLVTYFGEDSFAIFFST